MRESPNLFEAAAARDPLATPLAERMRPHTLDELVGQTHLLAPGRVLRRLIEHDRIPSMILWGPPGSGKTTLAQVVADHTGSAFEVLSATASGVRDIRAVVDRARRRRSDEGRTTILFIDEIHRFNKAQQDALLPHVEAGVCRLIGATTENPSFEVNAALLSRARVFVLRALSVQDLQRVLERALQAPGRGLGDRALTVEAGLLEGVARAAHGDARRALSLLETIADLAPDGPAAAGPTTADSQGQGEGEDEAATAPPVLTRALASEALAGAPLRYDKAGEEHYNVVSAFIKSMRASDPDAAVYWMTRMLEAGEDPMFVARRIVIFASEDVGNADPQALLVATAAANALHLIGMPEAVLALSQATLYLSLAPKSNCALAAWTAARKDVRAMGALPVPMVVRNAVTRLMKEMSYGAGYRYPHDFDGGVAPGHGTYLPEALTGRRAARNESGYPIAGAIGWEAEAAQRLEQRRGPVEPLLQSESRSQPSSEPSDD